MTQRHLLIVVLTGLLLCQLWSVVTAATPVFADPNQACAGFTPCFASVQEAINNAGPAPAEVGIFPGVYAESVNLSLMGSAIGESPGSLVLQALSSAGGATDSGVLIDPAAPGGPGTGPGLFTGTMMPLAGNLALLGLAMTSPDTSALGILMNGNLTVADLTLQNAASAGMVGMVDGDATLVRINASMNGASGIALGITGSANASELEATQNSGDGILLSVLENLTVQTAEASQNETGAEFFVCLDADVRDVTTNMNLSNGTLIFYGPDDCQPQTNASFLGLWQGSDAVRFYDQAGLPDSAPELSGGNIAGMLIAESIVSDGNGIAGIGINSDTGVAQLDGLFASDNAGPGIFLRSQRVELNDGEAIGNSTGVLVIADEVSMSRVIASQNQAIPANPPVEGSGIVVAAQLSVMNELQADDNAEAGLVLAEPAEGGIASHSLTQSQFDSNVIGIRSASNFQMEVVLDNISLIDNIAAGLSLSDLATARFSSVNVSGSNIGMDLNVSGQLLIETANVEANITGVRMEVEQNQFASITCSNFSGNTLAGVELALGTNLPANANYWGTGSGPTHPDNPGGNGDVVLDSATGSAGTVDYSGFLSQAATAADCPQQIADAVPVPALSMQGLGMLFIGLMLTGGFVHRRSRRS
jgi:hypothetical protein